MITHRALIQTIIIHQQEATETIVVQQIRATTVEHVLQEVVITIVVHQGQEVTHLPHQEVHVARQEAVTLLLHQTEVAAVVATHLLHLTGVAALQEAVIHHPAHQEAATHHRRQDRQVVEAVRLAHHQDLRAEVVVVDNNS